MSAPEPPISQPFNVQLPPPLTLLRCPLRKHMIYISGTITEMSPAPAKPAALHQISLYETSCKELRPWLAARWFSSHSGRYEFLRVQAGALLYVRNMNQPRDHLASGLQGQTVLAQRLRAYENDFVSFCDVIPWDKYHDPVSSLFPPLSRKNRQTALIIAGPRPDPPTQGVQSSDDEDDHEEGRNAVAALAKSAYLPFSLILNLK